MHKFPSFVVLSGMYYYSGETRNKGALGDYIWFAHPGNANKINYLYFSADYIHIGYAFRLNGGTVR